MDDKLFICSKLSVDCVRNDPVDVRCGGPEYLGFDFFVKEEEFSEMQKLVIATLNTLEIPLISIYESEKLTLTKKDIWTKESIVESIKSNCDDIKKEVKNNHILSLKK